MNRYYFTFGTDPEYPYRGGWVVIVAPDLHTAVEVFKLYYPGGKDNGWQTYADCYTEERFLNTGMGQTGNHGAYCRKVIGPWP